MRLSFSIPPGRRIGMAGLCLAVLVSGCTTAPTGPHMGPDTRPDMRPGTSQDRPGTVYDAQGRPLYRPPDPSGHRTFPVPPPVEARPATGEISPSPVAEEDIPSRPVSRIGGGTDVPENTGERKSTGPSGYRIAAVSPLLIEARRLTDAGELDQALATAERAQRISPDDPAIWNLMAGIHLRRGDDVQAEQMARKSNFLAGNDRGLQADNWRIIAESLENRGDRESARKARQAETALSH